MEGWTDGTHELPQQQSIVQLLLLGNSGLHSENVPRYAPLQDFPGSAAWMSRWITVSLSVLNSVMW